MKKKNHLLHVGIFTHSKFFKTTLTPDDLLICQQCLDFLVEDIKSEGLVTGKHALKR